MHDKSTDQLDDSLPPSEYQGLTPQEEATRGQTESNDKPKDEGSDSGFGARSSTSTTTIAFNNKATPLHIASSNGQVDSVKFLTLDKGYDPSCKDMHGNTPLHVAALYSHLTVVTFYIEELNCDPNIPGLNGMTPLHSAAHQGHVDIMKYLIDSAKCNPSQVDNDKSTPLHIFAC